ncbi:MAG: mevalonate kinase [Saprospirales bacterium]|jgi:mevalonate kinase|nr:mevalonate kinase [Saprospirales bacterium]MBK8350419.1 mevalonate kinase [Saprospirales bacterium]
MSKNEQTFNSKILLFGEYSIIQDSMGLTLPYNEFSGKLTFDANEMNEQFVTESNDHLVEFANYIQNLLATKKLAIDFDIDAFKQDVENGMYFQSSIPQGFGVGSSGALVAAVYGKYTKNKITIDSAPNKGTILELKAILAKLESHFHGSSSGVDPLICYLNLPLLINGKNGVEPVKVEMNAVGKGAIFLIDTGISRSTEPLVKYYMERMEEPSFRAFVDKQLKPFANNCIQAFLDGDKETLFAYMKLLSKFQFEHFKPMIPKLFNKMWKRGLDSGEYYLKLCGAGGGGFILGFTQNFEHTKKQLKGQNLELLCSI